MPTTSRGARDEDDRSIDSVMNSRSVDTPKNVLWLIFDARRRKQQGEEDEGRTMWASGGKEGEERPKFQLLINDEETDDDFWGEDEKEKEPKKDRMVDADLLSLSDSFKGITIGGNLSMNFSGDEVIVHCGEEEANGGAIDERAQCDIIRYEIGELEKTKAQVERALSFEQPQFIGMNRKRRLKRSYDPMTELDKRKIQIDKQLIAKRKELVKLLQIIKRKSRTSNMANRMELESSGSCNSSLQSSLSLHSSEDSEHTTMVSSISRKKMKQGEEEERENLVGNVGYSGALEDVAKEMGGTVLWEAAIRLELGMLHSIPLLLLFLTPPPPSSPSSRYRDTL